MTDAEYESDPRTKRMAEFVAFVLENYPNKMLMDRPPSPQGGPKTSTLHKWGVELLTEAGHKNVKVIPVRKKAKK